MHSIIDPFSRFKQTMFALIIGIDDYINLPKLRAAVADAKAMKRYLEQTLQVPEDHIRTLLDRDATRDAIIQAFYDLRNDERIEKGNPIVIFYSGHGGELPDPTSEEPESKIRCLLSHDSTNTSISLITSIPDRTVVSLIKDIAKVKGDNISAIFDCNYSASFGPDLWEEPAGKVRPGFAGYGFQSHILLAACGEGECAYEHEGRGQFTTALLETLKNYPIDDLTYNEVLEHIHLTKQTPHCEGFNQHRIIFDTKVPAGRRVHYAVRAGSGGRYVIGAGLAHGVTHGVGFTFYNNRNRKLGVVVVNNAAEIMDFQTTVTTSMRFTNVSSAKLTHVGNLLLYLTLGENYLSSVFEEITRNVSVNGPNTPTFQLVKEIDEAKLVVAVEMDSVVLRVLDQRLKSLGLTDVSFKTTPSHLTHVLSAAAHYYWYLDLTRPGRNNYMDSKNAVTVDFFLLQESEEECDDYRIPLLLPVEPSFRRRDPNTDSPDIIDFVVDPDALYGIRLTNNTARNLYLNAFLFNNSTLSIAPCYTQSSIGNPEAPLKQNATFTIGYGPGGTAPFTYSLEEGRDIDVGYLKIFFATQPIDLSDIVLPPPFSTDGQWWIDADGRTAKKVSPLVLSEPKETWFTFDIPVVQRRRETRGL